MITAKDIMRQIDEALVEFGTYTYHDKGAEEVMDIKTIADELKTMTANDVVKTLQEVKDNHKDPSRALEAIVCGLDRWKGIEADKFFETELFQELYG